MFNTESITIRFVIVIVVILGLLIPMILVMSLVTERQRFFEEAIDDVANAWSGSQSVAGPIVVIQTKELTPESKASAYEIRQYVRTPQQFDLTHETTHELRERGIYKIPVFTAKIESSSTFNPFDLNQHSGDIENIALAIGISDSRGIKQVTLTWNDEVIEEYSIARIPGIGSSVQAQITSEMFERGGNVALSLELRGTRRFSVLPVGDETSIQMVSDWPDPKFDGNYLPDQSSVDENGFTASWTTHALARGFASVVDAEDMAIALNSLDHQPGRRADLGYSILSLDTPYRAIERCIKYGILFIVLTMVSIVCIEIVTTARFHIVQYGVVGIGLVMFFLTVLSLSEHIGFDWGYLIASAILTLMNVAYSWSVTRSNLVAAGLASMLIVLYGALYFILQLDEFALLFGTILLLVLLAALMFATKSLRPKISESTSD